MGVLSDVLYNAFFYGRVLLRAVWCSSMVFIFLFAYFGLIIPMVPFKFIWFVYAIYFMLLFIFIFSISVVSSIFLGKFTSLTVSLGTLLYSTSEVIAIERNTVIEFGDDLSACCEERAVVICNHQSTADVPTLMAALQGKGVACRKTMWVVAGMFKWSPFGVIAQVHGDHFIWEGKTVRDKEIVRLGSHLQKVFWARDRRWVILFPEGGFLYKRLETSQSFAKKNGYPVLKYVTLPRMGAFKAILDAIGPRPSEDMDDLANNELKMKKVGSMKLLKDTVGAIRTKKYLTESMPPVKYVLDVTIAFKDGVALSADQLWFGSRRASEDIAVYYKVYDVQNVPFQDDDKLRDWMFARFVEKEKMLENYYSTGEMVTGEYGRRIHFPLWKILCGYLFWIGAAFTEVKVYGYMFSLAYAYVKLLVWVFIGEY